MQPFKPFNAKTDVSGEIIEGEDGIQQLSTINMTTDDEHMPSITISPPSAVTSPSGQTTEEHFGRGRLPSRDLTHTHERSPSPSRGHTPSEDHRGRLYKHNHAVNLTKKNASFALPFRHRREEALSARPIRRHERNKSDGHTPRGRLYDRQKQQELSRSPSPSRAHSRQSGERYRDERKPPRLSRWSRDRSSMSRGRGIRARQRSHVHYRRSGSPDHGMRGRAYHTGESNKYRVRDQSPSRGPKQFARSENARELRNRKSFPNQYAELRMSKRITKYD